jgi:GDPmannose 4,6-dehydratase
MAKVIIVGSEGQDGKLLTQSLINKGHAVQGIGKKSVKIDGLEKIGSHIDIISNKAVDDLLCDFKPDQVYYLAAYHESSEGLHHIKDVNEEYIKAHSINVLGLLNFLNGIKKQKLKCKLFYASSSLVFGGNFGPMQNELTAFDPQGIYGITKLQGTFLAQEYRKKYDLFASCGILYNHESKWRSPKYLSAKIITTALRIAKGSKEKLVIGNIDAVVDWGHASDYVEAFQSILSIEKPDNYIVATGEGHTVREFIEIVFDYFSIDYAEYVEINKNILTRIHHIKIGNSAKLFKDTGWRPSTSFNDFVIRLIRDIQGD